MTKQKRSFSLYSFNKLDVFTEINPEVTGLNFYHLKYSSSALGD